MQKLKNWITKRQPQEQAELQPKQEQETQTVVNRRNDLRAVAQRTTKRSIWAYRWLIRTGIVLGITIPFVLLAQSALDWATLRQGGLSKDEFEITLERYKANVGALGTVATVVGAVFLLLNFRNAERRLEIDTEKIRKDTELAEKRLFIDRFSKAVEQLSSEKLEIRLGGIYALQQMAKDYLENYWKVIDVLTIFVRERSLLQPTNKKAEQLSLPLTFSDSLELSERKLIPISIDIQAALTVIGEDAVLKEEATQKINLRMANLDRAKLSKTDFRQAILNRADLREAELSEIRLSRAELKWADLSGTDLNEAILDQADFTGSNLSGAQLNKAQLNGTNFSGADLSGAYLNEAHLIGSDFSGAKLHGAFLREARLSGTDLSTAEGLNKFQLQAAKLCQVKLPHYLSDLDPDRDC